VKPRNLPGLSSSTVCQVSDAVLITSIRQAAAVCDVSPPVVRRWLSLGLIAEPPWSPGQLQKTRDITDPEGRQRGNRAPHGTITRWNAGCSWLNVADSKATTPGHAGGAERKSGGLMYAGQLLEAIYAGKPILGHGQG
jgi:hypothetical protein